MNITGKFNAASNERLGIIALNPNGSVEYIAQAKSGANGNISTEVKIDQTKSGTHSIVINSANSNLGMVLDVNVGNNISEKDYDFWTETDISGLSASISYSASKLTASSEITSAAEISNTSSSEKVITVFNIIYDSAENIVEHRLFQTLLKLIQQERLKNKRKCRIRLRDINGKLLCGSETETIGIQCDQYVHQKKLIHQVQRPPPPKQKTHL